MGADKESLAAYDQYELESEAVNGDKPGNPPSWVTDEGAWEKAKEVARAVDSDGKLTSGDIYPFATWYYLNRLGGTTKEDDSLSGADSMAVAMMGKELPKIPVKRGAEDNSVGNSVET